MTTKRRMTQAVLQKVGKADNIEDTEYETRKNRLLSLQPIITRTLLHAENYIKAVRGACHVPSSITSRRSQRVCFIVFTCNRGCFCLALSMPSAALQLAGRTLAEDFADFYSEASDTAGAADPGVRAATVAFLEAIVGLDDISEGLMVRVVECLMPGVCGDSTNIALSCREQQTETLQEAVIDPLRSKVAAIKNARKLMKDREKTRLDYAAYLRNVRSLKAKGDRGDKLAAVRTTCLWPVHATVPLCARR